MDAIDDNIGILFCSNRWHFVFYLFRMFFLLVVLAGRAENRKPNRIFYLCDAMLHLSFGHTGYTDAITQLSVSESKWKPWRCVVIIWYL